MASYYNVIRCFTYLFLSAPLYSIGGISLYQMAKYIWADQKAALDIRESPSYLVIIKSKIHYSFL